MSATTCTTELAIQHGTAGCWIVHGTAGGVPFVAEGATEADALAEAAALVFECHGRRRLEALLERERTARLRQDTDPQEANQC